MLQSGSTALVYSVQYCGWLETWLCVEHGNPTALENQPHTRLASRDRPACKKPLVRLVYHWCGMQWGMAQTTLQGWWRGGGGEVILSDSGTFKEGKTPFFSSEARGQYKPQKI
jgi:hypothetical protein